MSDNILIIDSNLKYNKSLESFLSDEGYQPIFAMNSNEAMEKAIEYSPRLILLNSHEQELNSIETSKKLKTENKTTNIPIVVISEQSCIQSMRKFVEAGASEVVIIKNNETDFIYDVHEIINTYLPVQEPEKNISILAAEDDIVIRRLVEFLLKKHGYRNLRISADGKDAWQKFQQKTPELVILDYLMPYLTGFDVLQKIRENHDYDHIPIIFLTAVDDKAKLIEALNAGATDYITKPFDQAELLARVSTHARNYYLQKQLLEINTHLAKMNKELSLKNSQIEEDLRSAYKIQESLLPKETISNNKVKINFFYKPCHSVGGDFLNYFQLDNNHIGFYIADVSGHGVTSAMITVFVREQINNLIKKFNPSKLTPASLLKQLNKIYNQEIYFSENGVYFTIFFGIFEINSKILQYASAGHHAFPLIQNKDDSIIELDKMDLAIGFADDFPYSDHKVQLNKNDRILLHTDGVIEIQNPKGELFGINRLKSFLISNSEIHGEEVLKKLVKTGEKYSERYEQKDDIALMLLEIQ